MKKIFFLGLLITISLFAQIELLADDYKVTPRRAKDSVRIFKDEIRPVVHRPDIIGYLHDTVDFVGLAYKSYIIAMEDGTQGYVDRSLTIRFNAEDGKL